MNRHMKRPDAEQWLSAMNNEMNIIYYNKV